MEPHWWYKRGDDGIEGPDHGPVTTQRPSNLIRSAEISSYALASQDREKWSLANCRSEILDALVAEQDAARSGAPAARADGCNRLDLGE